MKIVSGATPGQFQGPLDLPRANHRGRDQQSPDAVRREHLRLAQAGGADAHGSRGDQAPGDFRALVRLPMRAERLAPLSQERRHTGDIGFEPVQVQ